MAIHLPDDLLEQIASRAADLVAARRVSPYLRVDEAADYLRCSRQRIYDLLSSGRLTRCKDGSRVLVLRTEVDDYLAGRP